MGVFSGEFKGVTREFKEREGKERGYMEMGNDETRENIKMRQVKERVRGCPVCTPPGLGTWLSYPTP